MTKSSDCLTEGESFTLTVNYAPGDGKDEKVKFDTYEVGLLNPECTTRLERLLQPQSRELEQISTFHVRRFQGSIGEVVNVDVKGRICLCDFESSKDTGDLHRILAIQGAAAMITQRDDLEVSADIPVFTLPSEVFLDISRRTSSRAFASIQLHQNRETTWQPSSVDGPLSRTQTHPLQGSVQKSATASTSSSTSPSKSAESSPTAKLTESSPSFERSQDLPRFGVSLKGKDYSVDLELEAVDFSREEVRMEGFRDVVVVPVLKGLPHTELEKRTASWKGRVCLLVSTETSDTNYIQRVAENAGSLAMLVTQKPTTSSNFPVLLVSETVAKEAIAKAPLKARISIQAPQDSSNSLAACATSSPIGSQENREMKTYADVARNDDAGKHTTGKGFNVIGYIWDKTVGAVVGGAAGAMGGKKKHFFSEEDGTDLESDRKAFQKSLGRVNEVLSSSSEQAIHDKLAEAKGFLKKKKCLMGHLAAAAYFCGKVGSQDGESLRLALYERLGKVGAADGLRLLRRQPKMDPQPRDVMYRFLMEHCLEWSYNVVVTKTGDDHIVIIFLALFESGLIQRPEFSNAEWSNLRASIELGFFDRKKEELLLFLESGAFSAARLCFQPDLNRFLVELNRLREEKGEIRISAFLHNILLLMIQQELGNDSGCKNFVSVWTAVLSILGQVDFAGKTGVDRAPRLRLVSEILARASFRSCSSFEKLSRAYDSASPTHRDFEVIAQAMGKVLSTALSDSSVHLNDVSSLLDMPAGRLLARQDMEVTLDVFSECAMSERKTVGDKLAFLELLYRKLVGEKWTERVAPCMRRIIKCVGLAIEAEESDGVLAASLNFASQHPMAFVATRDVSSPIATGSIVNTKRRDPCNAVAIAFVDSARVAELIEQPVQLLGLPVKVDDDAKLYHAIFKQIGVFAREHCQAVDKAVAFYQSVVGRTELPSSLRDIADCIFAESIGSWKPLLLSDVKLQHKGVIDALFSEASVKSEERAGAQRATMDCSRNHLTSLVQSWVTRYSVNDVTADDLRSVLSADHSIIWSEFEKQCPVRFPAAASIREKLDELSLVEQQIEQLMTISIDDDTHLPLRSVLREYRCVPDQESGRPYLLDQLLLGDGDELTNSPTSKTLRVGAELLRALSELVAPNQVVFYILGFFAIKPSLLFRELIFQHVGADPCLGALIEAVATAQRLLVTMFGRTSHYAGVVQAHKILSMPNVKTATDLDLEYLVECRELGISTADVEEFRTIASLSDLATPLEDFLRCCRQFDMQLVENDETYTLLNDRTAEFFGSNPDDLGIDACRRFVDKLVRLVFDEVTEHTTQDALARLYSMLCLFSTLSRNAELWNYANEREWIGEDGLKRFYVERENVTNVLLGASSCYEMSVLDCLEPVVRLLSAVGSMCICQTVGELFRKCWDCSDVASALDSADFNRNVREVQTRLSELKDWFSNGVDEVTAARSWYNAANSTGVYAIVRKRDGEFQMNSSQFQLELRFSFDRDGEKEERSLSGADLEQFIQRLSLIQNEESSTSVAMQGFVDQFQSIARACGNVLSMEALGYEKLPLSEFRCRAGSDTIQEASSLLSESETMFRQFRAWLSEKRETYKVSLLFWTEELREIYNVLQRCHSECNDEALRSHLGAEAFRSYIVRLQPMWRRDYADTFSAVVRDCLATFYDRRANKIGGWLEEVSRLLDDVHRNLAATTTERVHSLSGQSEIVLHSVTCQQSEEQRILLEIQQQVFNDRLPRAFEVLDGSIPCSAERMDLFLHRVQAFPTCRFVVLHAEKLDSKNLEALLLFLSDRKIAFLGFALHCVQFGDTLIHTSPWVEGKTWDSSVLAQALDYWAPFVTNKVAVSVVSTPLCGTGKTRLIREEMSKFESGGLGRSTASIVIHEASSISSLVRSLRRNTGGAVGPCALHLSVAATPQHTKANDEWLRSINHFFFSLLALGSVFDSVSATSFNLPEVEWMIMLELPEELCSNSAFDWLSIHVPIIALCATFLSPSEAYVIDEEARRVCTYLRAYSDGTINRKFEKGSNKRIVLALDCSGSMEGTPYQDVTNNAVGILDSHVVEGDEFGVFLYDHEVHVHVDLHVVDSNLGNLRQQVRTLPFYGGGTSMYAALSTVLHSLSSRDPGMETWVICLTDGISDSVSYEQFRTQLAATPANVHIVAIGVNLHELYEQNLRAMCRKYADAADDAAQGFFVHADGTTAGMDRAFGVVKSNIPVSQTFELDGIMSDEECRGIMNHYLPPFVDRNDMISLSFWIRFLYRRTQVFDNNQSFNYNEVHDSLGSSLMEVMLLEVERLLGENQRRDWLLENHAQLIYDFTKPEAPEFRLVCTAPDELDPELRQKFVGLDLPGFEIPTKAGLDRRSALDRFLSQALDIPLQMRDGTEVLQCIDDNNFVLTLDFTMKLLNMHERVACRVPCLIEGETGVSKTALTKMYSILRNSALTHKANVAVETDLQAVEQQLVENGYTASASRDVVARLREVVLTGDEAAALALEILEEKLQERPPMFASAPTFTANLSTQERALHTLDFFAAASLETTFFEINVDASLTEMDFVMKFDEVRAVADRLLGSDATIVVFLDEINTSSVLGLLKEVVVDRSLAGQMLPKNIVVIAACNPPRSQIQVNTRERDLGKSWASGHYQVSKLPASVNKLKWAFGSLTHSQEKEFIFRRIEALGKDRIPPSLRASLTEVVSASHEMMRKFATRNIVDEISGNVQVHDKTDILADATTRAHATVSLRDIQRVFSLFAFFSSDLSFSLQEDPSSENDRLRRSMLLSVAIVYYLRLDGLSREEFLRVLAGLPTEQGQRIGLLFVLDQAMDVVMSHSEIPPGIAVTRGLRENVFVTLVCSMSQTPLIIVGPPGCSKTLAVHVVGDNANGSDSVSRFYGAKPRLSLFHYQCSKQSTSKEIASVFDQATQRQERVDAAKHRCVVFMDEAGLPEEEKESLKVLHYLLESHMSAKAKVGFVAISNHVLDAAKSNRCVMLLRQDPDEEEMLSIATGVLFDFRNDGQSYSFEVVMDGVSFAAARFANLLCVSYGSLFLEGSSLSHLNTFFGLRDFIYFMKALRCGSRMEAGRLVTSVQAVVEALERNFNGIPHNELRQVVAHVVNPLIDEGPPAGNPMESSLRSPVAVLKDALQANELIGQAQRSRYKLIIDCTDDDSILRLLSSGGVVCVSSRTLFKLSNLPDNADLERLRLVSGVKFAAMQGAFAVLSQTEPVNESFYDLFNQRFREITARDGTKTLYANIAVGGISRRSLVQPIFECVVHVRESNLHSIPAPFLNRFEKYRLTLSDVLRSGWSRFGSMAEIVSNALDRTAEIASVFRGGTSSLTWVSNRQTAESIFVDLLPHLGAHEGDPIHAIRHSGENDPIVVITNFLEHFTSLRDVAAHVQIVVPIATAVLPLDAMDDFHSISDVDTNEKVSSILSPRSDSLLSVDALAAIAQMTITRMSAFRLIQIATPEAIFANRNRIPHDLIEAYFEQEHFSLKRLLKRYAAIRSSLTVVHTRSDQFIHRIPSLSADRSSSSEASEAMDLVSTVVYSRPHELAIEHLSRLRSEAAVRGAIRSWAQHETRNTFLLLVDMSQEGALDRANFVRTCVEQERHENADKAFILLLHYSPSSSFQESSYPSLFLGGWEHVFLDSVGCDGSSVDVDRYIAIACKEMEGDILSTEELGKSFATLLPRAVSSLATRQLFYRGQDLPEAGFQLRREKLDDLLRTRLGSTTIGDIVCEKFSVLWLDSALRRITRQATDALLCGTTQLSLSMSIQSYLLQLFEAFATNLVCQANQWRNIDLSEDVDQDVIGLFTLMLKGLPHPPHEELLFQRGLVRLCPLPKYSGVECKPLFPFFHFISTCLDELVESVHESFLSADVPDEPLSAETCFQRALEALEDDGGIFAAASNGILERLVLVRQAVHFVQERHVEPGDRNGLFDRYVRQAVMFVLDQRPSSDKGCDLFGRYLRQYIEWKIGCVASETVFRWWSRQLQGCGDGSLGNILAIHVVARVKPLETMKVASVVSLLESIPDVSEENQSLVVSGNDNLCGVLLSCIEDSILKSSWPAVPWSVVLSMAREESLQSSKTDPGTIDRAQQLRRLCFVLTYEVGNTGLNRSTLLARLRSEKDCSLSLFLDSVDNQRKNALAQRLFEHFLSPSWLEATRSFWLDDLNFLLREIAQGVSLGRKLAIALLRSSTRRCDDDRLGHGDFSVAALQQVSRLISADDIPQFGGDGARLYLPQYIPWWLQNENNESGIDPPGILGDSTNPYATFLSTYHHSFGDGLPDVVFEMFLSTFAAEAESLTSEHLFLVLNNEIESEMSLKRQNYTQLSRLRAVGDSPETIRGTAVAAIALSARLVCWVAKVATEVATTMTATVFASVYATDALFLLDMLMSKREASWQYFFCGTILRLRGDGTLSAALTGPLAQLPWTQSWSEGIAANRDGAVHALQRAESELAEALEHEQRKAREMRHCPNCRQTFMVDQMNCGNFRCDGGFRGNGCGQPFNYAQTQPYVVDEAILAPLRARIALEQTQLRRSQEGGDLWTKARALEVPLATIEVSNKRASTESILPSYQILLAPSTPETNDVRNLLSLLWEASELSDKLSALPDMIEFYIWLHDTFCFLATRELAFDTVLGELMRKERLQNRFDAAGVNHILSLWERVKVGMNRFLAHTKQKVRWNCEEVQIPFAKIENATMASLLSDGAHPTDGNDFLFLVIMEAVADYNNFAGKLASSASSRASAMDEAVMIQPRFIVRGFGGAVSVGSIAPPSKDDLNWVAECSWDEANNEYDHGQVLALLGKMINLNAQPAIIADPMNHLRVKFAFRDDSLLSSGKSTDSTVVTVDKTGNYFAHSHDSQLVGEVLHVLNALEAGSRDSAIRRTLIDNFYDMEYDKIRAVLEGCRNFLELVGSFGAQASFRHVGSTLRDVVYDTLNTDGVMLLRDVGFPDLTDQQSALMLSLDSNQFIEFVHFAAYQLASEAHIYSSLPLSMMDPLTDEQARELAVAMSRRESDPSKVAQAIDEFVKDILSFYELQLVRENASSTNVALRGFLARSNFCDESDLVFAALPSSITLRQYASLRQRLHQIKLSLLFQHSNMNAGPTHAETHHDDSLTSIRRGSCWLWDDKTRVASSDDNGVSIEEEREAHEATSGKLWFEQADPGSNSRSNMDADSGIDQHDIGQDACPIEHHVDSDSKQLHISDVELVAATAAARTVQVWWRRRTAELEELDQIDSDSDSASSASDESLDSEDGYAMNCDEEHAMDCDVEDMPKLVEANTTLLPLERDVANNAPVRDVEDEQKSVDAVENDAARRNLDDGFVEEHKSTDDNCSDDNDNSAGVAKYGSQNDERQLRSWLQQHRLPHDTADRLLLLGARTIADVCELVDEYPEAFDDFAFLDRKKLEKAVATLDKL